MVSNNFVPTFSDRSVNIQPYIYYFYKFKREVQRNQLLCVPNWPNTYNTLSVVQLNKWMKQNAPKSLVAFEDQQCSAFASKASESKEKFHQKKQQFWQLARGERTYLFLAVISAGVYSFSSVLIPAVFGRLIDTVVAESAYSEEANLGTVRRNRFLKIVGLFVVAGVSNFFRNLLIGKIGESIISKLRKRLYRAIMFQRQDIFDKHFSDKNPEVEAQGNSNSAVGSLTDMLNSDCNQVGSSLCLTIVNGSKDIFITLCSLGVMCKMSGKLTAIILFLNLPPLGVFSFFYGYIVRGLTLKMRKNMGEMASVSEERINNIRETIKVFNREEFETNYYDCKVDDVYDSSLKMLAVNASYVGTLHTVSYIALYGVLITATTMLSRSDKLIQNVNIPLVYSQVLDFFIGAVQSGSTSQLVNIQTTEGGGKVMSFLIYVLYFGLGLMGCAHSITSISKGQAAFSRVLNVMEIDSEDQSLLQKNKLVDISQNETKKKKTFAHFNVAFENVTFSYPSQPELPVFSNLSLKIPSEMSTCIVGSSGVGKSTLAYLILRLYDLQQENGYYGDPGRVTINGTNILDLDTQMLRSSIGYVGQEARLFSGTIAQNIAYGLSDSQSEWNCWDSPLTDEIYARVRAAAKKAHAHEFISYLPQGYNTYISGDSGSRAVAVGSTGELRNELTSRVSGGQKQRIAIARALIREPKLLILDEATSALDRESEAVVQRAINSLINSQNKNERITVLMLAHKVSMIQMASHVIMLGDGRVKSEGTYEEMCKSAEFTKLIGLV